MKDFLVNGLLILAWDVDYSSVTSGKLEARYVQTLDLASRTNEAKTRAFRPIIEALSILDTPYI